MSLDSDTMKGFDRFDDLLINGGEEDMKLWLQNRQISVEQLFTVFENPSSSDLRSETATGHLETLIEELVGKTPLHYAVTTFEKSPHIFRSFFEIIQKSRSSSEPKNIDVKIAWGTEDRMGFSPLFLASKLNLVNVIRELLSIGADVYEEHLIKLDDGSEYSTSSAFAVSIIFGSEDAFSYFLSNGIDSLHWDSNGFRPIHTAVKYGQYEMFQTLLEFDKALGINKRQLNSLYYTRESFQKHELPFSKKNDDNMIFQSDREMTENSEQFITNDSLEHESSHGRSWLRDEERSSNSEASSTSSRELIDPADLIDFQALLNLEQSDDIESIENWEGDIDTHFIRDQFDEIDLKEVSSEYGSNLLHLAVRYKNYNVVSYLLGLNESLQDVNDRRADGMGAIHIAAQNNDIKSIEMLARASADLNLRNDIFGYHPIHVAAERGSVDAVEYLLSNGVDPNCYDDNRYNPLHYAATKEEAAVCCELLISHGVELDAQSIEEETALYVAISRWNLPVFWKILQSGGNPGIPHADGTVVIGFIAANSMDELGKFATYIYSSRFKNLFDFDKVVGEEGQTALHLASSKGSFEAIKCLVASGASAEIKDENGVTPLQIVSKSTKLRKEEKSEIMMLLLSQVRNINSNHNELLHLATRERLYGVVDRLIYLGIDVNILHNSKTALHCAAELKDDFLIRVLTTNGASTEIKDNHGMNAAHICAQTNFFSGLKILLESNANSISTVMADGSTCLHLCSQERNKNVTGLIQTALAGGVDINALNENGDTALHLHIRKKSTEGVRSLIEGKCGLEIISKGGETPLMTASSVGHVESIRLLLSRGAGINTCNKEGRTALFCFSNSGSRSIRVITLLLNMGADINHKDLQGNTVLHHAISNNREKIVRFLVHKGADVNSQNTEEESALFLSAKLGYSNILDILLYKCGKKRKTDLNLTNKSGLSPYDIAKEKGHSEVMDMILSCMRVTLSSIAPSMSFREDSNLTSPKQISFEIIGAGVCAICQDDFRTGNRIRKLPCDHFFHDTCIAKWLGGENMSLNRNCPVCKQFIEPGSSFMKNIE